MADVDFNAFLARKYALLQQNADAGTLQANTGALVGAAGARLDNTRADLAPAESKSTIGLQGAQRNLLGEQAKVTVADSVARNALLAAQTGETNVNTRIAYQDGLVPQAGVPRIGSALVGVMGNSPFKPFRLSDGSVPGKSFIPKGTTPGTADYARYLDYLNP